MAGLLGWVIGPWLVLEVVRTKLLHYSLGCYPAMALLTAVLLYRWRNKLHEKMIDKTLNRMCLSALWIVGVIIAAAAMVVAIWILGPELVKVTESQGLRNELLAAAVLGGLVAIGTGLAVNRSLKKGTGQAAVAWGFAGVMIYGAIAGAWMAPIISSCRLSPKAAAVAKQLSPAETQFVLFDFPEPSIIWCLDSKKRVVRTESSSEFLKIYKEDRPICAIVSKKALDKLTAEGFEPSGPYQWVQGIYPSKWQRIELWVGVNKAAQDKKTD